MNLFSRLDSLLDGNDEQQPALLGGSRRNAERLVRKMESIFAAAQQAAVRLVSVERAAHHELTRQRQRAFTSQVAIEGLEGEQARAKSVKDAALKSLRELREGLEHARLLRDAMRRWSDAYEEAKWVRRWRHFWRAYHRLCDLVDARLEDSHAIGTEPLREAAATNS